MKAYSISCPQMRTEKKLGKKLLKKKKKMIAFPQRDHF